MSVPQSVIRGFGWEILVRLDGKEFVVDLGSDGPRICLTKEMVRDAGTEGLQKIADWVLNDMDAFKEQMIVEHRKKREEQEKQRPKIEKTKDEPKKKSGFVYLILANGLKSPDGKPYYKIGKTSILDKRLSFFGVKLPFPVSLIHTIETDNINLTEGYLHDRFSDRRREGEWFELTDDDVALIKSFTHL